MCSSGSVPPRGSGSAVPSRVPRPPRSAPGRRSRTASTRSSSRRPGRARRCRPSSGRSTGSSTRRMPRPRRPDPGTARRGRKRVDREPERTSILYVSPLKALGVDVERNLRSPLVGIAQAARRLGIESPAVSVGVRSGDTTSSERRQAGAASARHPHHDARVALPDAHEPGGRDAQGRAHGHRRRGARRRRHQARRPPRGEPRAARCHPGEAGAAHRALRDRAADRRGGAVPRRLRAGRDRRAALDQGLRPEGRRAGRRHAQSAARRGGGVRIRAPADAAD